MNKWSLRIDHGARAGWERDLKAVIITNSQSPKGRKEIQKVIDYQRRTKAAGKTRRDEAKGSRKKKDRGGRRCREKRRWKRRPLQIEYQAKEAKEAKNLEDYVITVLEENKIAEDQKAADLARGQNLWKGEEQIIGDRFADTVKIHVHFR